MEKLGYNSIYLYAHGLIKIIDPNYDHEVHKNSDDYDKLVINYFILVKEYI